MILNSKPNKVKKTSKCRTKSKPDAQQNEQHQEVKKLTTNKGAGPDQKPARTCFTLLLVTIIPLVLHDLRFVVPHMFCIYTVFPICLQRFHLFASMCFSLFRFLFLGAHSVCNAFPFSFPFIVLFVRRFRSDHCCFLFAWLNVCRNHFAFLF